VSWTQLIELLAALTGVAYVVLEILQKNAMWVVGIVTGAACAVSFAAQHVWASMGLNVYYVVVSVIGLVHWRRDGAAVGEGEIHLNPLSKKTALWSAVAFVLGSLAFMQLLRLLGGNASRLDAMATVLSVIATWWLVRSYLPQWLLWVVADVLSTLLCLQTGQYLMAGMYLAYCLSAVYGYVHWKKRGKIVHLPE